jgi:hypothetical protein
LVLVILIIGEDLFHDFDHSLAEYFFLRHVFVFCCYSQGSPLLSFGQMGDLFFGFIPVILGIADIGDRPWVCCSSG